jgi:hypothetical protein
VQTRACTLLVTMLHSGAAVGFGGVMGGGMHPVSKAALGCAECCLNSGRGVVNTASTEGVGRDPSVAASGRHADVFELASSPNATITERGLVESIRPIQACKWQRSGRGRPEAVGARAAGGPERRRQRECRQLALLAAVVALRHGSGLASGRRSLGWSGQGGQLDERQCLRDRSA